LIGKRGREKERERGEGKKGGVLFYHRQSEINARTVGEEEEGSIAARREREGKNVKSASHSAFICCSLGRGKERLPTTRMPFGEKKGGCHLVSLSRGKKTKKGGKKPCANTKLSRKNILNVVKRAQRREREERRLLPPRYPKDKTKRGGRGKEKRISPCPEKWIICHASRTGKKRKGGKPRKELFTFSFFKKKKKRGGGGGGGGGEFTPPQKKRRGAPPPPPSNKKALPPHTQKEPALPPFLLMGFTSKKEGGGVRRMLLLDYAG